MSGYPVIESWCDTLNSKLDFVVDVILICFLLYWNRETNVSTVIASMLGLILGIAGIG